jgi:hypothetical protein
MFFVKFGNISSGFTNQIFGLINGIIIAYNNKHKAVIINEFLDDYSVEKYTSITEIFDMDKINIFLKNKYDILIFDKNDINFELVTVKYGSRIRNIDLTDIVKQKYYKNNILHINKNCILNDINGDPCIGIAKQLFLKYKINGYEIEENYNEKLTEDICTDVLNSTYHHTWGWLNSNNTNMFEDILVNIEYNDSFKKKSQIVIDQINNNKINVIHLRLEDDGIVEWSKNNNMSKEDFRHCIEQKYINLIKKYFNKYEETIILSQSLSNGVIDFLKENNYTFKFIDKFFEYREKNAIIDLLIAKKCNNIFIGNFNTINLQGSTFSYYVGKSINENIKHVYIDINKIYDDEVVV